MKIEIQMDLVVGPSTKYRTKYLSQSKTLRYFQSDTFDKEIKNGSRVKKTIYTILEK